MHSKKERKGKERKSIYIAPFCTKVHSKRSGVDHTVLPANNTTAAFPSWRSPDVATTATAAADIQLQLTTHLSTPKGWKAEFRAWNSSGNCKIIWFDVGHIIWSFHVMAARAWNSLPTSVITATSLASFKKQLKTFLFTKSFPEF